MKIKSMMEAKQEYIEITADLHKDYLLNEIHHQQCAQDVGRLLAKKVGKFPIYMNALPEKDRQEVLDAARARIANLSAPANVTLRMTPHQRDQWEQAIKRENQERKVNGLSPVTESQVIERTLTNYAGTFNKAPTSPVVAQNSISPERK